MYPLHPAFTSQPFSVQAHSEVYHPPSKYINNYVINFQSSIGSGNFSTVYAAQNIHEPNNKYAVKLINVAKLREQNIEHLVKAEIEILKQTHHKNVISCKDVYSDEVWSYIVTDFYDGGNLQTLLKKRKYFSETEMLPIIKDIFQGLKYLEQRNIIHRDIKAANIFMKEGRAIVADLGFAKYYSQPFYDLHIGSLPFMPPQTLTQGYYCNKTDVWAFGALLCQIFQGESPFAKCLDLNDLIKNVYIPISVANLRMDLSAQLKQLIMCCLQIDVEKRPKFSEIERTWYFQKLYGFNINHMSNHNRRLRCVTGLPTYNNSLNIDEQIIKRSNQKYVEGLQLKVVNKNKSFMINDNFNQNMIYPSIGKPTSNIQRKKQNNIISIPNVQTEKASKNKTFSFDLNKENNKHFELNIEKDINKNKGIEIDGKKSLRNKQNLQGVVKKGIKNKKITFQFKMYR